MAAIFFDIDGTLWDMKHIIPESTKQAIKELQERGHLTFISSGRTKCFADDPALNALNMDGLLYGCGTHIIFKGETLHYVKLDNDLCEKAATTFLSYNQPTIMEGRDYLYMDKDNICFDEYGKHLYETCVPFTQPITDNKENWEVSKFSVVIHDTPYHEVLEMYKDEFTFLIHGEYVMEVVPKGYSKATAIEHVCELLGIDRKDTYAFGDSSNDLEMLEWVGTGIAMGNANQKAKEIADYVTDDLHADGIYNACKHFGLI